MYKKIILGLAVILINDPTRLLLNYDNYRLTVFSVKYKLNNIYNNSAFIFYCYRIPFFN